MQKVACLLTLSALLLTPALAEAQPLVPGELLASTGSQGGELLTLDPATGDGTFRCPLGSQGPVTEIEFREDGVLFGTTGGGSSNLIRIDPVGCVESYVGTHDYGSVNGLEFVGATLYGTFFNATMVESVEGFSPTSLVIVDPTDASLTVIDSLPYHPVRGLAWDAATSTMFGIGSGAPQLEGIGDYLFTVDLATGSTTSLGQTGYTFGSLELGPDGVLYAGENSPPSSAGPEGSAGLFSIDPATAQATLIGPTGAPGVSGLTFVPEGTTILAIPTLSMPGIAAFAALLFIAGAMLLRRHRPSNVR